MGVFGNPLLSPILKEVYESIVTVLIQSVFYSEIHQKKLLF